MIAGVSLVTLSILLVLPVTADVTALTREDLALALLVVLLGLLTMITRRNAIGQVVGFMSLENGLILAAVGVEGMPLIVEMLVAFAVMVAFIIFGVFFFHIRERFDTLDIAQPGNLPRGTPVIFLPVNPVHIILALPFLSAIGLAADRPPPWLATRRNALASGITLVAATTLLSDFPETTALSCGRLQRLSGAADGVRRLHDLAVQRQLYRARGRIGRLKPPFLRFYHSMFQAFMFTMLLALFANNLGVLWVAVEGATLTTVLMVSLYRTPAAMEAAWKY